MGWVVEGGFFSVTESNDLKEFLVEIGSIGRTTGVYLGVKILLWDGLA